MNRIIDDHLKQVVTKIEDLWYMTETAYGRIRQSFITNDRKLALRVSKDDKKINELEEDINDETIRVITLQAPVASDLRLLISSLKIANQLERIADYTVNIADHVLLADAEDETTSTIVDSYIVDMIEYVIKMLQLAHKAYITKDVELTKEIIAMDNKLDKIYAKSLNKIVGTADIMPEEFTHLNFNTILLVKYMERAGDHVVNICESVFYMVKGRNYDVHHSEIMENYDDDSEEVIENN